MNPISRSQDSRELLAAYRDQHPNDVFEIGKHVSRDQGLSAVVAALDKQGRHPVVVSSREDAIPSQFVTNIFASRERVAQILGCQENQLHSTISSAFKTPHEPNLVGLGPILDNVIAGTDLDLTELALRRHFANDRGSYLTSAIFAATNPKTGSANLSYHRCVPIGPNTIATSLHSRRHLWHYLQLAAENDSRLPVAIVIGGHPFFMLAAAARASEDVDEMALAGGLFGEPVDVVHTPKYGLAVPATAELVLEGYIDPNEHADEGPFAEFTGYASSRSTNNVVHVENLLHRDHPILTDVVGGNSADHLNLSRLPREAELIPMFMERFPSVREIYYPNSGVHFQSYMSVEERVPGDARQAVLALLGWDPYLKLVVAVDSDIDLRDDAQIMWALATRFQADKDFFAVPRLPGMLLDPSSHVDGTTTRVGIDATRGQDFSGARVDLSAEAQTAASNIIAAEA